MSKNLTTVCEHTIDASIVPTGAVVVDVGAWGYEFTRWMRSRYDARIVAIDPNPTMEAMQGVVLKRAAVFSSRSLPPNREAFYVTAGGPNNHYAVTSPPTNVGFTRVPCCSLEEVLEENSVVTADVLKLDCEGAEYDILLTMTRPLARQITVEFHDHVGRNPRPEDPEGFYADLHRHLGQWYEVVKHCKENPWGMGFHHVDSLYVLKGAG